MNRVLISVVVAAAFTALAKEPITFEELKNLAQQKSYPELLERAEGIPAVA